jgi:hypothetical protein
MFTECQYGLESRKYESVDQHVNIFYCAAYSVKWRKQVLAMLNLWVLLLLSVNYLHLLHAANQGFKVFNVI